MLNTKENFKIDLHENVPLGKILRYISTATDGFNICGCLLRTFMNSLITRLSALVLPHIIGDSSETHWSMIINTFKNDILKSR